MIFIVRLGTPRKAGEGVRLGTVRRPPRGVPKAYFAKLDYYDVWFPNLSPSAELVPEAQGAADERAWAAFSRKFRREMSDPVWSENLTLALRRPFQDERRLRNTSIRRGSASAKLASESTIGPFISDCLGRLRGGKPPARARFGTGWRTRTAVTITGALAEDGMAQAAAR